MWQHGPLLGQQFFIGNGLNSANLQQVFFVPDGATRLFFGIADGSGFVGNPDFYADNFGSYRVDYRLSNTVPEPSTIALSAFGLALLALSRRRRTA